jgi:hypothetical protein
MVDPIRVIGHMILEKVGVWLSDLISRVMYSVTREFSTAG